MQRLFWNVSKDRNFYRNFAAIYCNFFWVGDLNLPPTPLGVQNCRKPKDSPPFFG